jgi:hypothetical protein
MPAMSSVLTTVSASWSENTYAGVDMYTPSMRFYNLRMTAAGMVAIMILGE